MIHLEVFGMLVLSRKVGEQIFVPETGLVLTVLQIRGDKIRLGFTAPPEIHVYRQEVWDRIQAGRTTRQAQRSIARNDATHAV